MKLSVGRFVEKEMRGTIDGPVGDLELICRAPDEAGELVSAQYIAVVCHPHPLHGGTMDNKVVTTLTRAYRDLGVPVATFNFRGVGASDGQHDEGKGEVEDTLAVVKWLQACYPDRALLLAGFSFGSAMAAQLSHRLEGCLQHLLLVGPPVERYPYDREQRFPCPVSVLIGADDELVDVDNVSAWQKQLESDSSLTIYPQTGHFFHGKLVALKSDVCEQVINGVQR